jgi:FMN phosphatase YigB (HAD superfamily)
MGAGLSRSFVGTELASEATRRSWSSSPAPVFTRVYSLDALDTLYRFKKPIGQQYLDVARRCGLRRDVRPQQIMNAFKVVYKDMIKQYPNYGKGKLANSGVWWALLIQQTFDKATNGAEMPDDLTYQLYLHFSSSKAYELYPDVKPFFQRLRQMRRLWENTPNIRQEQWKDLPLVGVVSNSDPRVTGILQDLGLRVGCTAEQRTQTDGEAATIKIGPLTVNKQDPTLSWNPDNDIDFVCTSWEAGAEKPEHAIFDYAKRLATDVFIAQGAQYLLIEGPPTPRRLWDFSQVAQERSKLDWVHIGNDFQKDYQSAQKWGAVNSLYLRRADDDTALCMEARRVVKDARRSIKTLDDVWKL